MLRIRVINTGSKARAVQAVSYYYGKRKIVKHFGTAHTDIELEHLRNIAEQWIKDYTGQFSIFSEPNPNSVFFIDGCDFLGVYYTFLYDAISALQTQIGFNQVSSKLLADFVVIRIIEPASKLRSIELLATYFGIKHRRQNYYKEAPHWLSLKNSIEALVLSFAQQTFSFDYQLLFYDVTTLYFETLDDDGLRKQGFSKDNKSQQPQILVALMVSKEGFPIAYEIFPGNTFEGHTIIPVVQSFIQKNKASHFTIVADAAMISAANIEELLKAKIHYIVGARLGNLTQELIDKIDKEICREDGKTIRINTSNGYLICSYSNARYRKDKYEMEQIEKAKLIVANPSKSKRVTFIKSKDEKLEINQPLINKSENLLGIKGYYTDLDENIASNQTVIERYHELYRIEQAFRISKSDLKTRPIFHFKKDPIKLHLLISFMALVIAKYIELKTNVSIKRFITACKKITDARLFNKITNREMRIRVKYHQAVIDFIAALNLPH